MPFTIISLMPIISHHLCHFNFVLRYYTLVIKFVTLVIDRIIILIDRNFDVNDRGHTKNKKKEILVTHTFNKTILIYYLRPKRLQVGMQLIYILAIIQRCS